MESTLTHIYSIYETVLFVRMIQANNIAQEKEQSRASKRMNEKKMIKSIAHFSQYKNIVCVY